MKQIQLSLKCCNTAYFFAIG